MAASCKDDPSWFDSSYRLQPDLPSVETGLASERALVDRWPSGLWSRFAKPASVGSRPSVRIALYPPGEQLRLMVALRRCGSKDEREASNLVHAGSSPAICSSPGGLGSSPSGGFGGHSSIGRATGIRDWRSGNVPPCHGGVTGSYPVSRSAVRGPA